MHTYILLKTGGVWVVGSNNTGEETYSCFPLCDLKNRNSELFAYTTFQYSEVAESDTNLELLKSKSKGLRLIYEPLPGESIETACARALRIATLRTKFVEFRFNEIENIVCELDNYIKLVDLYKAKSKERGSCRTS